MQKNASAYGRLVSRGALKASVRILGKKNVRKHTTNWLEKNNS